MIRETVHSTARAVFRRSLAAEPEPTFNSRHVHVAFVGTKRHWEWFLSEDFCFPKPLSAHQKAVLIHLPATLYSLNN